MATTSRNQTNPLRTLLVFIGITAALFAIMAVGNIWSPKLGLDLRGGTTITLTAQNTSGAGGVDPASLELARTIIQQRVDSIGVGESQVTTAGENQITVAVPNVAPDELTEMVGKVAQLSFRPVYAVAAAPVDPAVTPAPTATPEPGATVAPEPTATPNRRPAPQALPRPVATPRPTAPGDTPLTTTEILAWQPTDRDEADFEAFACGDPFPEVADQPFITCDEDGTQKFLLAPVLLRGEQLTTASAGVPQGEVSWIVQLQFDDEGGRTFAEATTALAAKSEPQNSFAVVLDGRVMTYPRVNEPILNGGAQITGSFTQESATKLANVLKYGALPLAFDLSEVSTVSPTLGGEQLRAGIIAGIIGLILVVGYAFLYYRGLGIVVVASLAIAGLLTYALIVLLGEGMGFALNLPGIAGAIVAIGVTADSFVIFFERIRDEVREGRTLRSAIETGWQLSRRTILVADTVSLLSAVVLFILAIGAVKGFAFTLGLTTLIDIAIVFFFTKPLMSLLGRTKFFGEGHRFSGFEPEHMGATRRRGARVRRPATTLEEA